MNLNQINMAIYSTYLTNKYGFKLKKAKTSEEIFELRLEYAQKILKKLNICIEVLNKEKLPQEGKYLLISNHRSIVDPLIIEMALKDTKINGFWVAKKELYNSF
ncbi:MAG: 1-acyl-sn-glycerol-3-phosphate acyltransferase, partial [Halarcobacter sp.]